MVLSQKGEDQGSGTGWQVVYSIEGKRTENSRKDWWNQESGRENTDEERLGED